MTLRQRRRLWHPILVPLPVLAVLGTAGSDFANAISGDPVWAGTSLVLARGAVIAAPLAAAAGFRDFLLRPEVRGKGYAVVHFFAASALVIGTLWNLALHGAGEAVPSEAVALSLGNAVLVAVAGFAGLRLRRQPRAKPPNQTT